MKKTLTVLVLALFLLASAGFVFGAETAREGSDTGTTGFISTYQVLQHKLCAVYATPR